MPTPEQVQQYDELGYFIAEDTVDPAVLPELLAATRRAKKKVRSGRVDVYTHWATKENSEPWAIRGLLAPEFEEPIFAEHLLSGPIMNYVHYFLGNELRLGSILIFTNPYHEDWGFGWHRDFGKDVRNGTEEEEMAVLNRPLYSLRWHLALVDDACLELVPGSQRRYRTDREHECLTTDRNGDIPGGMAIPLKAGQALFWKGYAIHRGIMKKDVERLTIAASWRQHTPEEDQSEETDVRFKWRLRDDVRDVLPEAMKPYYDRWRVLQLG
jgi:hypothetical protein